MKKYSCEGFDKKLIHDSCLSIIAWLLEIKTYKLQSDENAWNETLSGQKEGKTIERQFVKNITINNWKR